MKILSAQRILNNTFKANNNEPTKHYLAKNESGDSFVRSNSNVSFKGGTRNLQKAAQKILGETDLLEKAGKFSAAFFATLVAIATGKEIKKEEVSAATYAAEAFLDSQNKEEVEISEQENTTLIETAEEATPIETETSVNETVLEEENPIAETKDNVDEQKVFSIELPKRPGVKSKNIKELIKINEMKLTLSEESSLKMKEICEYLANNKGNEVNSFAESLRTSLEKSQTDVEIDEVINSKHKVLFPNKQEVLDNNENTEIIAEEAVSQKPVERKPRARIATYENTSTGKIETGPKIVGRINVDEIEQKTRPTKMELNEEQSMIKDGIFVFKAPGTVSQDIGENLKSIWRSYKEYSYKKAEANGVVQKTKYMRHPVIGKVTVKDIKNDIIKRQKEGSPYKNIGKLDSYVLSEIADILDSDKIGFKEMFSIHGALRFIERFVNFDSDISIEEQCESLILSLKKAIRTEMAQGMNVESYKDTKGFKGARIVIKSDRLKNPAGFNLGGSYDILLTLCSGTEGTRPVKPIIHTILFK